MTRKMSIAPILFQNWVSIIYHYFGSKDEPQTIQIVLNTMKIHSDFRVIVIKLKNPIKIGEIWL